MKTKIITLLLLSICSISNIFAQDKTTVTATNSEISDNLDLRAVASIFGDSGDLGDFERRLNDPKSQISNLDLNNDNQVDYLRVIETIEGNTHIIVIQSVLGQDMFQDVATIEVDRDTHNQVQVQVIGDVYMYGNNYIYEPVYVAPPVIYTTFWIGNYHPYYSSWYWGYYPSYYYVWAPYPIFRYRSHIGGYINYNHQYNHGYHVRNEVAYNAYRGRRSNAYEQQYPTRSFTDRNKGFNNRQDLDKTRNIKTLTPRGNNSTPRNNGLSPRGNVNPKNNTISPRGNTTPKGNNGITPKENGSVTPRANTSPKNYNTVSPRDNTNPRNVSPPREVTPRVQQESPRQIATPRIETPRVNNTPRNQEVTPRGSNSRNESTPRQNKRN